MIYLIRHGQTDWVTGKSNNCPSDMPINETGIQQAKDVANEVASLNFDIVFCSPFARAQQTAEIIAGETPIIYDTRIREITFGTIGEVPTAKRREVFSAFHDGRITFPGAETIDQLEKRVTEFFDEIKEKHAGKRILVVAHAGIARFMRGYFEGIPSDRRYSVFPTIDTCRLFKLSDGK